MSESKRFVENIKNVILVVLFITTILLLYLLWSGESNTNIDISELLSFSGNKENTVQIRDVLLPSSVSWGEGDGSFSYETVDMAAPQEYFLNSVRHLYEGTVLVYTITKDQFKQAVMESPSSVLSWSVNIPFEEFCQYNEISSAGDEGIAYISSITISEAARDSIIVFDGEKDLYYRLAVDGAEMKPYSAENNQNEENSQSIYYPASIILGSVSDALLPVMEFSDLGDCRYEYESENDGEELGISMAEAVFGDTFDFVRRITDDFGTVTYMYGYGQKTLTANSDGSFEYKAETTGESAGFYGDLETALDFVSNCGGWDKESVEKISYKLINSTRSGSGKDATYTFSFAAYIKDYQIYSEEKCPIIVGISNGQVNYYYRHAFSIKAFEEGETIAVSDAANVIASNAGHMYKVMKNYALSPDTDEAFSFVSNAVVSIKKGYYRYDIGSSITPCWTVSMDDGSRFFFDLYEGVPLGFVR